MNLLAEKQKSLYEAGISRDEYTIRRKRFLKLYYRLRYMEDHNLLGRMSLSARRRLHRFILAVYTVKNWLGGFRCKVLHDRRSETGRPVIFAVTHVGKFDIEVVSEAIKEHYYLLSGDFEHIQGTIDAAFLNANGVLYFNEEVRSDRKSVTDRMISHLRRGGNLLYFPEGTWNLSPNLPVLPCYWGIIEVAKKGGAVIIPVAAEQYGKDFVVSIGENFDVHSYGENRAEAIARLRDILAALKWEIWESRPLARRDSIKQDEWDDYMTARFREWRYFNKEYVDSLIIHPKDVTAPLEAFAFMKRLKPCRENAFLFRDLRNGYWL